MTQIRNDWTVEEIRSLYHTPLLDLVFLAAGVHRQHQSNEVQLCTLLSIKTGGCSENCSYCPQSAHHKTGLKAEKLMEVTDVLKAAKRAKDAGSTRFCMGAAWRQVRDSKDFDNVLEMVKGVNELGLECCVTLGMLTEEQALKLKEAGLSAYNHNLDTSRSHYSNIITTRTYDERLTTLENVRKAGISVCCGGILGLGESDEDRIALIHTLATLPMHPESVPVNALVPAAGTPLANSPKVPPLELVRMVATARVTMPKAMVRLSAGRLDLSDAEQALCFLAGANSIFTGEKLLTTPNPAFDQDQRLLSLLGLQAKAPEPCSSEASCC